MKSVIKTIAILAAIVVGIYCVSLFLNKIDDNRFNNMLSDASNEQKQHMFDMLMDDEEFYEQAKTMITEDILYDTDATYYEANDVYRMLHMIFPYDNDEADSWEDTLTPYDVYEIIDGD